MSVHKEGYPIILAAFIILAIIFCAVYFIFRPKLPVNIAMAVVCLGLVLFVVRFFRKPTRDLVQNEKIIYAPADGTIVAIEEVYENEYFKADRLKVSIFMSIWDVHINWYPVNGNIVYFRHHQGKYLLARLPKSSELNERTTVVIKRDDGTEVLLRQIAGTVARRIVPYAQEGIVAKQGEEMGVIRFGSRVDVYLPLGTPVKVKLNEHVSGKITEIGNF